MTETRTRHISDIVLIALFAVIVVSPGAMFFLLPTLPMSLVERRLLVPAPPSPTDIESIRAFPNDFDLHFNDHIGFRDRLIRAHNYVKAVCI